MFRKRFGSFRVTKEKPRKKLNKDNYQDLRDALGPSINDVVSYLSDKNIISERKEERILCISSSVHKTQFLLDVIKTKDKDGQAIDALYEATLAFKLWQAADILEPSRAPHDPKQQAATSVLTWDDTNRPAFKHLPSKQVSWQDEGEVLPSYKAQDTNQKVALYPSTQVDQESVDYGKDEPDGTVKDAILNNGTVEDDVAIDGIIQDDVVKDGTVYEVVNNETMKDESGDEGSMGFLENLTTSDLDSFDDEKQNEEDMEKKDEIEPRYLSQLPIVVEKPDKTWTGVPGLHTIIESLAGVITLPLKFPHLFSGNRKPLRNFLLFGPDTNMNYLAKAIANETNATIFSVQSTDIVWYQDGVMEKLFQNARFQKPSIVFINELHALCKDEPKMARQMMIELMDQIGDARKDNDGILVLAGTNEPWTLDLRILSKFERKIYIPQPNAEVRANTFLMNLGNTPHGLTDSDLEELGQKTEGYSRTDIDGVLRNALMEPVRKVQNALFFRLVRGRSRKCPDVHEDDLLTPCAPSDPGAMEMSWMDVPGDKLVEPVVTMHDILIAMSNFRPTCSEDNDWRFRSFMDSYGIQE